MVRMLIVPFVILLFASAVSADPITFRFDGTITRGAPGGGPYPGIAVGERLSGEFTIDNLSGPGSVGTNFRSYDQSVPMHISLTNWDVIVGLDVDRLEAQFFTDTDRVSLVAPYRFKTPDTSGLGAGFLSIDFQFKPNTLSDSGPDAMPDWTSAVSATMGWTSPIGGITAVIDPGSVTRVPLPGTLLLFVSGLAGVIVLRRKIA
jgi:hypothetical protein